ncbi:hypothetical protein [Streptomyces sp. NBC_00842]|uniref:hypothetical protein n=1 Tax=Streptomyces sp. NBC_00842 TaxID=2975848 RepID=UPI002F90A2E5|nr:hypothetical protein OH821_44420 [Streptomyces sp. NBC_00842]
MATCTVCGKQLPARRGPRARQYCSRACQAKAYRTRQQHAGHRATAADEQALLREYEGASSLTLADDLASAARRLAGALTAGLPADHFDLAIVARIPVVLSARAQQAVPTGEAVHGIPDTTASPTTTVIDLTETAADTVTAPAAVSTPAQTSRDDSPKPARRRSAARPKRLSRKAAMAIAEAAVLEKHSDHRDNHRWILRSGDTVLGHVEPSYGGASRSGRTGWVGILAGGFSRGQRCATREAAAVDLMGSWIRVSTAPARRTITGP